MSQYRSAKIETTSRWPIGAFHWSVPTTEADFDGIAMSISGVAMTLRGAKRAIRRCERRRDNVRKWEVK